MLILKDWELPTNLIVLSIREFDVILVIDFLTRFHAIMDYVGKLITFFIFGNLVIYFPVQSIK